MFAVTRASATPCFVAPEFWTGLDGETRREFAGSLARLCEAEELGNRTLVIDESTGKAVAEYANGRYDSR